MKKITFLLISFMMINFANFANAGSWGIGIEASSNSLDTAGKEDVDNNGTIDDTKNVSDDIAIAAIFAEYTNMGDRFGITVGLNYIPFDADIDKRSITQSSLKGKDDGAAASGTNSVEGTVENHKTIYIQPGYMIKPNTMLYGTLGYASATINGKSVSLTHTDINKDEDLEGVKIGIGVKHVYDNGVFVKADYSETEYDTVSFTTSNDTRATADLDNSAIALSVGKQF